MSPCRLIFTSKEIELESRALCEYLNYHLVMFVLCGSMSFALMCVVLVLIIRFGRNMTPEQEVIIELFTKKAFVFCIMALGLEGAVALCYVIFFCLVIFTTMHICFREIWLLVVRTVRFSARRRNVIVSAPDTIHIVVISNSCPICLETDDGPWYTTPCGHTFHIACIDKWRRETCPLCRGRVGLG
jgi:hypothetical protein